MKSPSWPQDIADMHEKYGFHEAVRSLTPENLLEFLKFRIRFLEEELSEANQAILNKNADDLVDAMIDLCVVAIGTIDLLDVDAQRAWDRVHFANMAKEVGIKESRPNPLKLPDLIKPPEWTPPYHLDNTGFINRAFDEDKS